MLTLRLKSGEYVAIGDSIAVQVFRGKGNSLEVAVKAPREVPVCRGEVYEQRHSRPQGLRDQPGQSPSERGAELRRRENQAQRTQAVRQINSILDKWKEDNPALQRDIAQIRAQLVRVHKEGEG